MPSETALQIIEEQEEAAELLQRSFGLSYHRAMIEVLSFQHGESGGTETTLCLECKDEIDIEEAIEGHCACCAHQIAYANAY
jgi:hypothetical protein